MEFVVGLPVAEVEGNGCFAHEDGTRLEEGGCYVGVGGGWRLGWMFVVVGGVAEGGGETGGIVAFFDGEGYAVQGTEWL